MPLKIICNIIYKGVTVDKKIYIKNSDINIYIKKANIYKNEMPLFLKTLLKTVFITFIICCAFVAVFNFIYSYTLVEGKSMYPTLNGSTYNEEGILLGEDSVYINRFTGYKRGDLVVFNNPGSSSQNKYVVKRLIALEGERIAISENGIYLIKKHSDSIELLVENYLNNGVSLEHTASDFLGYRMRNSSKFEAVNSAVYGELYFLQLEEDEVFILGDNRSLNSSNDSADYGGVKAFKYVGKIDIIVYQSKNNFSYIFGYFWKKLFG